jgi:hypothetical protein
MTCSKTFFAAALIASLGLVACSSGDKSTGSTQDATVSGSAKPAPAVADTSGASPGKPMAPISIQYEVIGNPIIGQPVLINVEVSSAEGPVDVQYSITDGSALMFQQGQVERYQFAGTSEDSMRQVSVIPQREGRLYVNVSAEVQTPGGPMMRSMAIPIKVGAAPEEATINGELKVGPEGETVISMPAQESN